jgi:DNA-binding Xre family transcriptional regulator
MTLTELAEHAGISIVNLSILKNGHARAIRFTSLTRICQALSCQPGDLITCTTSPQTLRGRPGTSPEVPAATRGLAVDPSSGQASEPAHSRSVP